MPGTAEAVKRGRLTQRHTALRVGEFGWPSGVGNVQPGPVQLNPALPILKEIEIIGSGHALASDLRRVVDLVARGLVRPRIAERVPVGDAAHAHTLLATRGAVGRVVLTHG